MRVVPVVEDDEFDQFVEEAEVIYVNDGLQMSRDMVIFMTIWSMKK